MHCLTALRTLVAPMVSMVPESITGGRNSSAAFYLGDHIFCAGSQTSDNHIKSNVHRSLISSILFQKYIAEQSVNRISDNLIRFTYSM